MMAPSLSRPSRARPVASIRRHTCPARLTPHGYSLRRPQEVSSFIGRREQIHEVSARVRNARLVTLAGEGGIGKTRLALKVADALDGAYACRWTALDCVADEATLARAVADALTGSDEDETLLVLDNCEHVIEACARVVLHLLQARPNVRVLATSRERMGVPGEVVYPLAPLVVPDEAVQLFFERARARDPRLPANHEIEDHVTRICQSLGGVPLAIELAALRTSTMTIAEIADRVDDSLGLLTMGARTAPPRQRSLRASLDWSYALLDESERRLLRRLARLPDSFTLDAATAFSEFDTAEMDQVDALDRLVSHSLVQGNHQERAMHFSLPAHVRRYVLERLEQAGEATVPLELTTRPAPTQISIVPARPRHESVLSERERDVVMLIAGGRSNRQIASELVITKKTAEAHVSHILTKLGMCSRVQIATWGIQQGLVPREPESVDVA